MQKIINMRSLIFDSVFCMFIVMFLAPAEEAISQNNNFETNTLGFEIRTDFDYFNAKDTVSSGFRGKNLNFVLKGNLTKKLSYNYRQRINVKNISDINDLYQGTDIISIDYQITKNLSVSAGKHVMAIGGWEYDAVPIDIYFITLFSTNIDCYQLGVNTSFTSNNKKNTIILQVTNSPFTPGPSVGNLYNYSVLWYGNFKHFKTSYAFNMLEYKKGAFISYISTGTILDFGAVNAYFDFTNRATAQQKGYLFNDMSITGRINYKLFDKKLVIYAKAGYDVNEAQDLDTPVDKIYDLCILPGTDCKFYGGGIEFFPIQGKNNIRLHAFFAYNDARCIPEIKDNLLIKKDKTTSYQANIGLTWRINFIKK